MRHMHVTHFETSTLTRQTTWPQSRNTALVCYLRQWICLIHELRQLRCTKELFQCSRNRLAVDQIMWHQRLLLCLTQTLFNCFLNPRQTGTVLVLSQFTNATYTTIAQMINIINFTASISQINQNFNHRQNVFIGHHHRTSRLGAPHFGIKFHSTNTRQIVCIWVVKQALEQSLHCIFCRWLARTHHAINSNARSKLINGFVSAQSLRNI